MLPTLILPVALIVGGVVGFLAGATFDPSLRPDWSAISAMLTATAITVALTPIIRDRALRTRTQAALCEQARANLEMLVALLLSGERRTIPTELGESQRQVQLVTELSGLVGRIEELKPEHYRKLLGAVAGLRALLIVNASSPPVRLIDNVISDVKEAIRILSLRRK